MRLRLFRFAVIMLAALSLSFGVGHLMELPARIGWDQYLWVGSTAQGGPFRLSGPLGVLFQVTALIGLVMLALLTHRNRARGLQLAVAAVALFALGLACWWFLVYPANVELAGWANGPVPATWTETRTRWELGQAANGAFQLMGFAALVASVTLRRSKKDKKRS